MRRVATLLVVVATFSLVGALPSAAQSTPILEWAASALRRDPVYVDPDASSSLDAAAAERLRPRIRSSGKPIFIAVLPSAAVQEAGRDAGRLPSELFLRVGLAGTYAVVAGDNFRAGSNAFAPGQAAAAATAAFQARRDAGTEAVLTDFIDRVGALQASTAPVASPVPGVGSSSAKEGGGPNWLLILLALGAVVAGVVVWQLGKRKRREAAANLIRDREALRAELSVLAEDVVKLEPAVDLQPDARDDYEAGVSRFRVAQPALDAADDPVDLVRVKRVLDEGRYAMSRARAILDGRDPPPPPPDLARRGTHDERGRPRYGGGDF